MIDLSEYESTSKSVMINNILFTMTVYYKTKDTPEIIQILYNNKVLYIPCTTEEPLSKEQLEELLEIAIDNEDYIEAAKLRDKLNLL